MENETLKRLVLKYENKEISLKRLLLDIQVNKGVLTDKDVYYLFSECNIPLKDIEHWVRITPSLEIVEASQHHIHLCMGPICTLKRKNEVYDLIYQNELYQVHEVGCMGLCDLGPTAAVDGKVFNDINHNQPFLNAIKSK